MSVSVLRELPTAEKPREGFKSHRAALFPAPYHCPAICAFHYIEILIF